MSTKVYLVEDHSLMRQTLREAIEKTSDLVVCGMAASAEEALLEIEAAQPDVVLLDVSLPGMSGIALVTALRERWPALFCIVVSGYKENSYVQQAFAAGAHGYLVKGNPFEIGRAVLAVLAGNRYISPPLRLHEGNDKGQ